MMLKHIDNELKSFYLELIEIKDTSSSKEIYLPIFLDDMVLFSLFLVKKEDKIILSTNLLSELEYTFQEKISSKNDFRKKYIKNKEEFKEIKEALKQFKINVESDFLEYIIENIIDEKEIAKEIICYSERIKKYYNNIYHNLIERYLNKDKKEKNKFFYESFKEAMDKINEISNIQRYKNTISNNPIYTNEQKIIAAAKDLDSLARLYIDIAEIDDINEKKGLLYLDYKKGNEDKIEVLKNKFEKLNFLIKQKEKITSDNVFIEIREFINE
ncbi:hypothetical protein [uncultured Cetobacterium sp.]|uniref:hypothetical protein n=1 Tax=uncultured Cetobacterium sp. TaxID=527638 RepID=UPI00261415DB|nr:hypothetical protein [uncultured Cetobacterium sp.]